MRLTVSVTIAAVLALVVMTMGDASPPIEREPASNTAPLTATSAKPDVEDDPLIVHEWGTFTSFSGSDGVRLEYRPLLDEDLPHFVLDRFLQSGKLQSWLKSRIRVRMRMETPVTYFYTNRERDVNVRVGFPQGLLTEFYPPVAKMLPAYKFGEKPTLKNSLLDWGRVHLIPTDRLTANIDDPKRRQLIESRMLTGLIPPDDGSHSHYYHARETDSALVHVHIENSNDYKTLSFAPAGDYFEKFLFYRVVGNFSLPLKLTAAGDGRFELQNSGPDAFESLFLVTVNGDQLRMAEFDRIDAGARMTLVQSKQTSSIDQLHRAVVVALIKQGLYKKEAEAMVNTWRSSWFGEQGTRLFYTLPQRMTDELLPLEIEPQPDTIVRVMVGRMELMTPEDEARVIELVRNSAGLRKTAAAKAKKTGKRFSYTLPPELAKLGRLAEPALVRVRALTDDPVVRSEAQQLLQFLKARS